MKLIIMRTSLCALERQKGRTYVPAVWNYGYAPLSQIFSYPELFLVPLISFLVALKLFLVLLKIQTFEPNGTP